MRVVLQRVSSAAVSIDKQIRAEIGFGLLILLGIATDDSHEDILYLCSKIISLRIFNDTDNKMNLSIADIQGDILLISQFTLFAASAKGRRPSYTRAAAPPIALPLYHLFIKILSDMLAKPVQTGEFGADMKVSLCNDGPTTIIIDSRQRDF